MNGIVEFIKDENLHQITSLTAADKAILQLLPTFFNSLNSTHLLLSPLTFFVICSACCTAGEVRTKPFRKNSTKIKVTNAE